MILKKLARGVLMMLSLFLLANVALAQNKTVTGKVTDSKGDPVPSATVTAKGTKNSTTTAADGSFRISVPTGASTLVISSVGFGSQEVSISGKDDVSVSLETKNAALNEVVVVGYGTRKVKDATGSVASIQTKDFNKGQISTPEQLIQGRTPGVSITPSSGEPGAAAVINIRGSASIRGSQEPLYVVDGVPISGGGTSATASGVEGSSTPKNPLMFLNPADIESITILKDASSAAIYGSRGANGVIIITTKSGRGKKGSFNFSASTSFASAANRYDLLNAKDFLDAVKAANINAGTPAADAAIAVKAVDKGYNTDWQKEIFRLGVSQNYNLGWGFANKGTALRLSGSYDEQQGIIKNSSLKRLTGRANFSQKFLKDKLKFEATLSYSNVKNQYPPLTNNAGYQGSLMGAAITFNPTYPVRNPDGSYFDPKDGNRNPSQMLGYFDDKDNINRFLTNLSLSYEIVKGLTYKATLGYDDSKSERLSFADPRLSSNAFGGTNNVFGKDLQNPIQGNGRSVKQNVGLKSVLVEHTLAYDKALNNGHVINAIAGYSFQSSETNYKGKVGWGLTTPVVNANDVFVKDFGNFTKYYDFVPDYSRSELQSYFGRLNYTINEKYFLTATVRIDGSSKFGENNKYGTFPAFAAKWRLLNENFIEKSLGKVFSDLSIRANFGILGSQDGLGPYDAIDLQQKYIGNSGNIETSFLHQGNKDLKWEQAATTGVGIDFALLNNRLSGTVDYFYSKRKDILFYGPVPGGFSATSYYFSNLPGYVVNKGLEFSFNYKVIKGKKFNWDVNYNMTFIHNEVKDMKVIVNTGAVSGQGLSGAYAQTIVDGSPLFTWKMPIFYGYDLDGFARYGDQKDHLVGSALPKFNAGLTNNFSLGNWSASVFVNASTGFYVYNNTANALFLKGSIKTAHNVTYAVANSNESAINPGSVSTRFLEKGDFIRISNVNLSYSFDVKPGKAIKSLSVYGSGQNLALFTNYTGLDPEVNVDKNINGYPSRGFDYVGYPKARTFTFGVNLGF
ncbi:MAG: SusC/RagA family TonB-linked outer membrane protein [Lacibacter sp.]